MTIRPVSKLSLILFSLVGLFAVAFYSPTQNTISAQDENDTTADPAWLEPRPLSVVDLLSGGINPDWLVGTTLSWIPGFAHMELTSASVSGTEIIINASVTPTTNVLLCAGNFPYNDQWPVSVPESLLTIRANGVDITDKVTRINYIPAGKYQPATGSKAGVLRYDRVQDNSPSYSGGKLSLPANMGCFITLDSTYTNVTASYEFDVPTYISIEVLGGREKDLASFYWPLENLNVAKLRKLNIQMYNRFSEFGRHDRAILDLPSGTEYVLPIFKSVSIDPYSSTPGEAKGGGTYRIRHEGTPANLSVDHTTLSGLPINGQTIDQDYHPNVTYLPFYSTNNRYELMALEVIVLNQPYNICMTNGNCSTALLDIIDADRMAVEIYYLKVTRISPTGMTQIPLKQTGPNWSPGSRNIEDGAAISIATESDTSEVLPVAIPDISATNYVYLPIVSKPVEIPSDNPTGACPCGWFTEDGRMLDFVSPP